MQNNHPIDFNYETSIKPSANYKSLSFLRPAVHETGYYKCVAVNKYSDSEEFNFNLIISPLAEIDISDIDLNQNLKKYINLEKDEKLTIDCLSKKQTKEFYWSEFIEVFPKRTQHHLMYYSKFVRFKKNQTIIILIKIIF